MINKHVDMARAAMAGILSMVALAGCPEDVEDDVRLTLTPAEITVGVNQEFEVSAQISSNRGLLEADLYLLPQAGLTDPFPTETNPYSTRLDQNESETVQVGARCGETPGAYQATVWLDGGTDADRWPAYIAVQCEAQGGTGAGGTGAAGTGAAGTGAAGAGAGGPGGAGGVFIPPGTTDCTIDANGCLVADVNNCDIMLDDPIQGSDVAVHVEGVLADNIGLNFVDVFGFTVDADPHPSGPTGSIDRSGTEADALLHYDFLQKDNTFWDIPAGDYPFSMDLVFNNTGAGSAQLTVTGEGAPTTSLSSDDMGTTMDSGIVVFLRNSTVCRIDVTTP